MIVTRTLFAIFAYIIVAPTLLLAKGPPFELPPQSEILKIKSCIISTAKGDLYFELFPGDAPWHVANFKYLADQGFYRGLHFRLFHPGYIIQGGAPRADPDSGPGYSVPAEFNPVKHLRGTLGMARVGDHLNPSRDSHGSQFHILLSDDPRMDGKYTAFGRLLKGYEVLERLRPGDDIHNITVFVRSGTPSN